MLHQDNNSNSGRRNTGVAETEERITQPSRRGFLRSMAAGGVSVPAGYFLLKGSAHGSPGSDYATTVAARSANQDFGLRRSKSSTSNRSKHKGPFVRDFSDPYLELVRLLREAAEVEHSLMIQYLYAAFSLKPEYSEIVGGISPTTDTFLGVAVQEMQHLGAVNRLLGALGATPNLMTQDLPYEPDIYPFEITMDACSPVSLSKYSYCEAPTGALDRKLAKSPRDHAYIDAVTSALGDKLRPNQVGSFYDTVIAMVEEFGKSGIAEDELSRPFDTEMWVEKLKFVQEEGEVGHFEFFKDVLLGTHAGFKGRPNIWDLPKDHAHYPTMTLPSNPSAFVGHPNQIRDPGAQSLAWLSDLHYWISLAALTYAYHFGSQNFISVAHNHMIGPMLSIARELPKHGAAIPFDQLSMGYCPGMKSADCLRFIKHLVDEAAEVENRLGGHLPTSYDRSITASTQEEVDHIFNWMKVGRI